MYRKIWQVNIGKTIVAHVPVTQGQVQETGDFELDGVTFPAAEVQIEFLDPSDDDGEGGSMFPTGNVIDMFEVPEKAVFRLHLLMQAFPPIFKCSRFRVYRHGVTRTD